MKSVDAAATLKAGGRLAGALCARAGGGLVAEPGEACGGFYHPGLWLMRATDRQQLAFLNMSVGGGSLHVFRRLDGAPPDQGQNRLELDWTGPRAGADWPADTVDAAVRALGLTM